MKNLIQFENFGQQQVDEADCNSCSGMSNEAKLAIESLCEKILCQEAQSYHTDEDVTHTYEGYCDECSGYMKEIMGQAGYQSLVKTHAE